MPWATFRTATTAPAAHQPKLARGSRLLPTATAGEPVFVLPPTLLSRDLKGACTVVQLPPNRERSGTETAFSTERQPNPQERR